MHPNLPPAPLLTLEILRFKVPSTQGLVSECSWFLPREAARIPFQSDPFFSQLKWSLRSLVDNPHRQACGDILLTLSTIIFKPTLQK